jgi:hypothetical protein
MATGGGALNIIEWRERVGVPRSCYALFPVARASILVSARRFCWISRASCAEAQRHGIRQKRLDQAKKLARGREKVRNTL